MAVSLSPRVHLKPHHIEFFTKELQSYKRTSFLKVLPDHYLVRRQLSTDSFMELMKTNIETEIGMVVLDS